MAKKDLTPKQKSFKKRYLDINDQFVSYKNVQDIKNYYRLFPESKQPTNLKEQISTMSAEEIKEIADMGRKKYTEPLKESFLVDSAFGAFGHGKFTSETTTDMRLSQAEAEGTKLFYKDKEVTKKELQQILQDYSDDKKEQALDQDESWYKTYALLSVDYKNNTITFDESTEFNPIQDKPTDTQYFKTQQEWRKNRK